MLSEIACKQLLYTKDLTHDSSSDKVSSIYAKIRPPTPKEARFLFTKRKETVFMMFLMLRKNNSRIRRFCFLCSEIFRHTFVLVVVYSCPIITHQLEIAALSYQYVSLHKQCRIYIQARAHLSFMRPTYYCRLSSAT